MPCPLAPVGWKCTRVAGHEGPCAAWPIEHHPRDWLRRFWNWWFCVWNGHNWQFTREIELIEQGRYQFHFVCRWCGKGGSDKR